jgi:hypothetical protein
MKRISTLSVCLVILLIFFSCGKDNSSHELVKTNIATVNPSLTVSLNKTQITANGTEQATITVKDENNADVTALSVIYVNDNIVTKNIFSTVVPGSYMVKAVKGSITSQVVIFTAVSFTTTSFTQKTLAEFFTGTWCGICPGVLIPFESYINSNPNTIVVGVHGPIGSSDPFQYIYDTQLRTAFKIYSVPTVLLNRNYTWDNNNSSLDQLTKNKAIIGIGLETSLSGSNIAVKVNVKFGIGITTPLKLVVMLVEDGLIYDQTNYGHFNLPNPIANYVHRNVLRTTATDAFGDPISIALQTKDNVYQKSFTVDASKYTISNCRIVAFVLYDTNNVGNIGVLNSQIVTAGESILF